MQIGGNKEEHHKTYENHQKTGHRRDSNSPIMPAEMTRARKTCCKQWVRKWRRDSQNLRRSKHENGITSCGMCRGCLHDAWVLRGHCLPPSLPLQDQASSSKTGATE